MGVRAFSGLGSLRWTCGGPSAAAPVSDLQVSSCLLLHLCSCHPSPQGAAGGPCLCHSCLQEAQDLRVSCGGGRAGHKAGPGHPFYNVRASQVYTRWPPFLDHLRNLLRSGQLPRCVGMQVCQRQTRSRASKGSTLQSPSDPTEEGGTSDSLAGCISISWTQG